MPVPVDEAWRVLLDIERIAPCMPGAALDSVTGDDFTGRVKVKLGVITLTYQGKASFIEKDEAAHRAVIDARGRDQRGNGTASAVVTATLAAEGDRTRVDVLTDLNITGRPAQFGRGVMTDVGNKLLGQFADRLAAATAPATSGPRRSRRGRPSRWPRRSRLPRRRRRQRRPEAAPVAAAVASVPSIPARSSSLPASPSRSTCSRSPVGPPRAGTRARPRGSGSSSSWSSGSSAVVAEPGASAVDFGPAT